ncbi:DUF4099 domain-containing protein [Flavobacterium poyangense]|uniref:DUF4099 domain-containing protein n=1 Tax=Flavobacterium poyangense TaxID=2204302 RepID=UPI00141DF03B|nr:DUF3945 domain-containing protein [Flavobacterium sp. JXAS1]
MNEQDKRIPEISPEQLMDILLVLDKERMKIEAVRGIDEKSRELKTAPVSKRYQNQFMVVDRQGDVFSNFFSNFMRQLQNPTRFKFFKVPKEQAVDIAAKMQKEIHNPEVENAKLLEKYEVKTELKSNDNKENVNTMKTTETPPENNQYRYQADQIDWNTMNNFGLSKEKLEKMELLEPLLKGYKTNELVPISLNLGTAITRLDARLSLQTNDEGKVVVAIHGIRKEPQLNYPFFGHEFSQEDKDNLLKTGNMGRVVNLTNLKTNEQIPSIISIDRLTNELVALRTDKINLPEEIKGIKLDEQQKQTLMQGKPLYLEGMISRKGEPFDATVQFNADKRYVEFHFDRSNFKEQTQGNMQKSPQDPSQEVPKTFRGVELSDKQYNQFKTGKTIYIDNLEDKNGKKYEGYITFNKETGKTDFAFKHPDKTNEQEKPTKADKTNLRSEQDEPKGKKQQEDPENSNEPARSKGRKM